MRQKYIAVLIFFILSYLLPGITYADLSEFGFGVEYAQEGIARVYSETGANWVKICCVDWGRIEPNPPNEKKHSYEWKRLDNIISEFQSYNFHIQIEIKARSLWASKPVPKDMPFTQGFVSTAPKDEYWDDYSNFVYNLVERYDGDGVNDMPGLKMPILHFEIESEAQHNLYWQGTVDEYKRLLKTAYTAAKKANPNSRIILSGLSFGDIFDDQPIQEEFNGRIDSLPPRVKQFIVRSVMFIKEILKEKDYFDEVEFHYLNDYRGIFGQLNWIKKEMRRNGYEKPIWAGDATAAPMIVPPTPSFNPYFPRGKGETVFSILSDKRDPEYQKTASWFFAEQAKNLVKKFIVGMEQGLRGIMMGNSIDWPSFKIKSFVYQGLIDEAKRPRPAYHSYKLLIEKLKGIKNIERVNNDKDIYIYRFSGDGKRLYAVWSEKGDQVIKIDTKANKLKLYHIIIGLGESHPKEEDLTPVEGTVSIKATSEPVLLSEVE